MSFEAQNWADKVKVGNASQKAVLKTMANCADQDGYCWPSASYIAASCELSLRTVRYAIEALANMGLIVKTERVRDNGSYQSNHYQMLLSVSHPMTQKRPEIRGGDGATIAPSTVQPLHGDGATAAPLESSIESPIKKNSSSENPKTPPEVDPDDLIAAQYIFSKIKALVPGAREPNWRRWCNDIRLMQERDSRSRRDICKLFAWANADPFWSTNILSPANLRKHWVGLWLKANSEAVGEGRASPALVSIETTCHCGQVGVWRDRSGPWLCGFHRDETQEAMGRR